MTTTINSDRLWDAIMKMAQIGPGVAGGNNRQTLTDADAEGRSLFKQWCNEAGLSMSVDSMGNMFAQRDGADNSLAPVYIGSHLDTQPTGGKYDGVLGVLGALEVIRTLNDHGIQTQHPLVVVNWTNEEGTRFAPAMLSSGVFAGLYTQEWAYDRTDAAGKRFGDELARIGWVGDEKVGERKIHAYLELHIEQGPILEKENKDIGVVTHGQGLNWLEVTLIGKESHTGSTPMPMRVNAGLGMARITEWVNTIALKHAPLAVGAIGHCDVYPNSRNIIPGRVVFTIDFRHPVKSVISAMEEELRERAAEVVADIGLQMEINKIGSFDPVTFAPECVAAVRAGAEHHGYTHRDIISGAGHDACWINKVAPTSMIMCPCVGGLSHNEAEDIFPEWATAGANVLLYAALQMAGRT